MVKIHKYGFYRYVKAILVLAMLSGAFFFAYRNELFNYETAILFVLVTTFFVILILWQLSSQIVLKDGSIIIKCFGMNIKEMKVNNTTFKLNGYEDPNSYHSLTNKSEPYYSISTTDKISKDHYEIKIYDKKDYLTFLNILQKTVELT